MWHSSTYEDMACCHNIPQQDNPRLVAFKKGVIRRCWVKIILSIVLIVISATIIMEHYSLRDTPTFEIAVIYLKAWARVIGAMVVVVVLLLIIYRLCRRVPLIYEEERGRQRLPKYRDGETHLRGPLTILQLTGWLECVVEKARPDEKEQSAATGASLPQSLPSSRCTSIHPPPWMGLTANSPG